MTDLYTLMVQDANLGGKQYLGLTITTTAVGNVSQIDIISMRGKTERDALQ